MKLGLILIGGIALAQNGPMLPSEAHRFRAVVTAAEGSVSMEEDSGPWAIGKGEDVPVQRTIITGRDGYAKLEVDGGSSFEIYANSRVAFRQNPGYSGDLLDIISGHVRVHLAMAAGTAPERVRCRTATISTYEPSTIALATDQDGAVRLDVIEGSVSVRHSVHPDIDPVVVRAVDAIVILPDERISHRVERGTLYRYTVKPVRDLLDKITKQPKVQEQPVLARLLPPLQ